MQSAASTFVIVPGGEHHAYLRGSPQVGPPATSRACRPSVRAVAGVIVPGALVAMGSHGRKARRRLLRGWHREAGRPQDKDHRSWILSCRATVQRSEVPDTESVSSDEGRSPLADQSEPRSEPALVDAWEDALHGSTGDIFTEPAALRRMIPFIDAPGDEVVDTLRFERVSRGGDEGDLVLYVPGVDFTGLFAAAQFRGLAQQGCELWRCYVPADDRTPFVRLARSLEAWLQGRLQGQRRVVVVAESFGGLLAMNVALRLGNALSGLVLVNPATSYGRTIWPLAGRALSALPPSQVAIQPKGGLSTEAFLQDMWERASQSPYAYLGSTFVTGTVAHGSQIQRIASKVALDVLDANASQSDSAEFMQEFLTFPEELEKILPPDTVKFRLRAWLRDGSEEVNSSLRLKSTRSVNLPPVLLISGDDSFLPSRSECRRLEKIFEKQCPKNGIKVVELDDCGHAPLDDRVDLAALLLKSPIWEPKKRARNYVEDWTLPGPEDMEAGSESVEGLASFLSPVFLSTVPGTGERKFGLDGLPDMPLSGNRPLLFVGNHQQLALELGPIVREVILEKGYAPRGLAHPINFEEGRAELFQKAEEAESRATPAVVESSPSPPSVLDLLGLPFELRAAVKALSSADDGADEENEGDKQENPGLAMQDFTKWGAVPVNPKNFFKMLQRGEPILLYPGGPAEALALPEDKYKLFWPSKTDFVRAAAKFNAIVVPFGNIGSADNFQGWGDLEPLREFFPPPLGTRGWPKTGGPKLDSEGLMPVSEALETPLDFPALLPATQLASETAPGVGDRIYVSFGQPVDLSDVDPKDRLACQAKYEEIRGAVEAEIDYLLQAREEDPYRSFVRRQVYERLANASPSPRIIQKGPLQGTVLKSYGPRAPSFALPVSSKEQESPDVQHHDIEPSS